MQAGIVFVFPGQGSQYVGMGKELAQAFPIAAQTFKEAEETLGWPLTKLCFEGPPEELAQTQITQPAVLAVEVACLRVLTEHGVEPQAAAGHSLGEYAALVAAGSLSFPQALKLVARRGELMAQACAPGKGGMVAVLGVSAAQVEEICRRVKRGVAEPANYNAPGQVVVAGDQEGLEELMELARKEGAKRVVQLNVSGPFHSSLMKPAAEGLKVELERVTFSRPRIPVVSNVTADYVQEVEEIRQNLITQVASPVRWEESIKRLISDGFEIFIEVGPGNVLSGLVRRIAPEVKLARVEDPETLVNTLKMLGKEG
ncbi:[Acyl-carrier-protein] S-malonyltransferase [Thermanaeromonas toyohensis ToBE]|uniref:Malonyl CoA-acyl carrier protein transacylase n=1 Tax=Thermanaeromonas toyohensis ToBE TaxID=698762 RepID=A0A1W1VP07_9FIRM|nr:ACP S-malonyltransferase [Thermanaeromonas toyohensis]SMB94811.1 [Acyl-carrier-protein] S-malonyltransferase [Thermanaeromonas toyohensis ToBE]